LTDDGPVYHALSVVDLSRSKSIKCSDDRYAEANFYKFRVRNKVSEGSALILEIAECPENRALDGLKEALIPKTSSIRVSIELRLVTDIDRRTDAVAPPGFSNRGE